MGFLTIHSVVKSCDNTFKYDFSVVTVRGKEDEVAILYFAAKLMDKMKLKRKRIKLSFSYVLQMSHRLFLFVVFPLTYNTLKLP